MRRAQAGGVGARGGERAQAWGSAESVRPENSSLSVSHWRCVSQDLIAMCRRTSTSYCRPDALDLNVRTVVVLPSPQMRSFTKLLVLACSGSTQPLSASASSCARTGCVQERKAEGVDTGG